MNMNMNMSISGSSHYDVLSLASRDVGQAEIKKAYRSLALRLHPDLHASPSAKHDSTLRFIQLREAYDTLSDPTSRHLYDLHLAHHHHSSPSAAAAAFSKDVWQSQLRGLRRRSHLRMKSRPPTF